MKKLLLLTMLVSGANLFSVHTGKRYWRYYYKLQKKALTSIVSELELHVMSGYTDRVPTEEKKLQLEVSKQALINGYMSRRGMSESGAEERCNKFMNFLVKITTKG